MRKRLLRSVLAAALSAVALIGVSGYSGAGDTRADSHWPESVASDATSNVLADSHWPAIVADSER
jgi:DNA transposition AAA+ family ATPase